MTARGDSLRCSRNPRVQLQIGLNRTKGIPTSVPTTPQNSKSFMHCKSGMSVAHELSGLSSTRVVRFLASVRRRIDEPDDMATGPQDAEVLRCVEPMDAQRAFGSGSERGGDDAQLAPAEMEQHGQFGSFTSPPVARRGTRLGGHLQRGYRFCLASQGGQATTGQIAEWCRPEIVYAGGKPTAIQIAKHARALRSSGARKARRGGPQWVGRLGDGSRRGRPMQELVEAQERRPALTASVRGVPEPLQVGTKKRSPRRTKKLTRRGSKNVMPQAA